MNSILLLSSGVPLLWMIGGFLYFLTPPNNENNKIGIVALDKNGKEVIIEDCGRIPKKVRPQNTDYFHQVYV